MFRLLSRLIPILIVTSLLVTAAPVAAQRDPVPPPPADPAPNPPERDRVVCVPVGLALAVLSQDGTVADILPAERRPSDAAGIAGQHIVLDGPAVVGACADFQGFWGPGAFGTESATLVLSARTGSALSQPVARDGLEEERRGPAMLREGLKAVTKLEDPGTYPFSALLTVKAERPATNAASPSAEEDSLRIQFTVEIRERKPDPEKKYGAITGTVATIGPDGNVVPVEGAIVAAKPAVSASGRRFGYVLPIVRPVVLGGDEPGEPGPGRAVTDADGKYKIEVPVGAYLVIAEKRGFAKQYYDGKQGPRDADKVKVAADETTAGIDFKLLTTLYPEPPEPQAHGVIKGVVTEHTLVGGPIAGALVMAVPATASGTPPRDPGPRPLDDDPPAPGLPDPNRGPAARTDEDGAYELKVPEGKWIVMATAEGYAPEWFDDAAEPKDAKVFEIAKDSEHEADFALDKMAFATVAGSVMRNGQLVAGAKVLATTVPEPNAAGQPRPVQVKTETDEAGEFTMDVPPGEYVVGVVLGRTSGANTAIWYWPGTMYVDDAERFELEAGDVADDLHFELR